jgi:hypothetical protein
MLLEAVAVMRVAEIPGRNAGAMPTANGRIS